MISHIRFQYEENSLNGIITNLKNSYYNIYYELKATVNPQYYYLGGIYCIDRNSSSFCHSTNSSTAYFELFFSGYKVILEGYSIQNRDGYFWDLLNWKVQGSNDHISYYDLDIQNLIESEEYCGKNKIRSYPISSHIEYSLLNSYN